MNRGHGTPAVPPPDEAARQPQSPASNEVEARVAASIENWKRKLLDLTKRNRALNFRVNKVSTVTVVDELPAEVFRQLYLRGVAMRFQTAPEPESAIAGGPGQGDGQSTPGAVPSAIDGADSIYDEEEVAPVGAEFAPYDPASAADRHTDDRLQTNASPEALDKSLRRLDEQARSTIDEQGVNTLFLALGMLHYSESDDSQQLFGAPLVLLPVELSRKSARTGYQLRATDEDPIVNPALAEYVRQFGMELPELPDSSTLGEDYDLQVLLSRVADVVARKDGWSVNNDIFLAPFSFQKFVMYKDLEANSGALSVHRLIRQLITRTGGQIAGLPAEIREMDLDVEYPPETTFQVVDADSSQLRAIAACAKHHDLVIEGPPGTGKSQTITNLVAQALAADKSVLFVAEKMAALDVVHSRLLQAGLGEFCLELHSTKANKRAVVKELARALDASFQGVAVPTVSTARLPGVRATLSEYVKAVHLPHGTLGISPFRAYGEFGRLYDAPRFRYGGAVDGVTVERLDQTVRDLQDLAVASTLIGPPAEHPWRDATKTFYSEEDLASCENLARQVSTGIADVGRRAGAVGDAFGLPPVRLFADVEIVAAVAAVLGRSPGAPLEVLRSDAWNAPPREAIDLVEKGRALARLKARVSGLFKASVLEQEHAPDIEYVEERSRGFFSFLAILDGRYRSIRRRWHGYRLSTYTGSLIDQAAEMKLVDRLLSQRAELSAAEGEAAALFGGLWQGERSRWELLDSYVRWVVEFRSMCVRHGLSGRAMEVASRAAPDISDVRGLEAAAEETRLVLGDLRSAVGWPAQYLDDSPVHEIAERAQAIADHTSKGPQWAAFEAARQEVGNGLAAELLPAAMTREVSFRDLAPAFLRAFYVKWLSAVVQARPPLQRFNTLTHQERVAEFQQMDERVLKENRGALVAQLRDRVQHRLQQPPASEQLPHLRREMARQRGLAPLRRTMRQAGAAIRAIKPCFMMSPLSVAQYLDSSGPCFDLVIFDEASQLPAEDAVGAIVRTKQLVVVGDPKQLPPTNFFSVSSGNVNAPLADDGTPLYDDSESILEEFMGAGVPMSRLKWHYRSAHESLISFSNVSFYEADLYTFPSVTTGTEHGGLQFEFVEDGVYEGKGLNQKEARRVAWAVADFAREQALCAERGEPVLSLGVGTFNLRQQLAIQDQLEVLRREDPSIEPFFDRGRVEPLFVKNLENIQGDERDVIFISVTYAKGVDGRLRYQFGPLNGENGWRRLNVLVTRARQRMRVFSSMRGDEINAAATTSRGARLLREFLVYAERGRLESVSATLAAETESPFERDVLQELTRRGLEVVPQVGVAGYRIDLGVLDEAAPGRFLCGIECDGVAYHSSETARDRDRLRQQVLEARGWTIHRVWSTDWFKDRQGQIERLLGLIEECRECAREEAVAEREARRRIDEQNAERARVKAESVGTSGGSPEDGAPLTTPLDRPYERPAGAAYVLTEGEGRFAGSDILNAPFGQIGEAILRVVDTESPIHELEMMSRVAGMWGKKLGSRIQSRILEGCGAVERGGGVQRRGAFLWSPPTSERCGFRSRSGTKMNGERIAPEEYREAILAVLGSGHAFARDQLTKEVRAVFGFSRTGSVLDEVIGSVLDTMLHEGMLGEASIGIRIRA